MKDPKSILGTIGKWIVAAVLAAMVLMVFVNSVLRYVAHTNIVQFEELSRYLFVWTAFLGAIIGYVEGKHVGVDIVVNSLHGLPQLILRLIGQLLCLGASILILYGGVLYFKVTYKNPAPVTGLPFGFVAVSGIVLAVACIIIIFRDTIKIVNNYRHGVRDTKSIKEMIEEVDK